MEKSGREGRKREGDGATEPGKGEKENGTDGGTQRASPALPARCPHLSAAAKPRAAPPARGRGREAGGERRPGRDGGGAGGAGSGGRGSLTAPAKMAARGGTSGMELAPLPLPPAAAWRER